jgi:hypothetical protein
MNRILALISLSIFAATAAIAADRSAKAPSASAATTADQTAKTAGADQPGKTEAADQPVKIELKNKSSFAMDAGSRNPFWPIGWKPAAKLSGAKGDQGGDIPVSAFLVSTITVEQGARFAIINGKTMQEGQQFGLLLGTQTYQIVLKKIEDGRVILGRHDQEIIVPLRRK